MKIVVLDFFTLNPGDLDISALSALGEVVSYDRTPPDLVVERALGAEIVLTNKTKINSGQIQQLTGLRYIGVLATGYDCVDVNAAAEHGIIVTNVPGYGTTSVAQMVFALLLELCQHVQRHGDAVQAGDWSRSPDFCFWHYPQIELAGKTIGIMGYGTIGQQVAQIAHAFGMNILACSRSRHEDAWTKQAISSGRLHWAEWEELQSAADVISLHCPLTTETSEMINHNALSRMKPTAFLINTSRGKLVNEAELVSALEKGTIAGAALDVLSVEPPAADHPLIHARNCLVTPHIAWASKEARGRLLQIAIDNITAFLAGKPANRVNRSK